MGEISEIALLEAQLAHLSAIARCAIGQPDREERVADRERVRQKLEAALSKRHSDRIAIADSCCGKCVGPCYVDQMTGA